MHSYVRMILRALSEKPDNRVVIDAAQIVRHLKLRTSNERQFDVLQKITRAQKAIKSGNSPLDFSAFPHFLSHQTSKLDKESSENARHNP